MSRKELIVLFVIAFALWALPFFVRMFVIDTADLHPVKEQERAAEDTIYSAMADNIVNKEEAPAEDTFVSEVNTLMNNGELSKVFYMIFSNNIKGCFVNIMGGFTLGITTAFNMLFNGFSASDIFTTVAESDMGISGVLETTLPHSFELIGFWLSGAIGLSITWQLIRFMRGRDIFNMLYVRQLVLATIIMTVLILGAAYVETYVSLNNVYLKWIN